MIDQPRSCAVAVVIDTKYARPEDLTRTLDALAHQAKVAGAVHVLLTSDPDTASDVLVLLDGVHHDPAYCDLAIAWNHTKSASTAIARKRAAVQRIVSLHVLFLNAGDGLAPHTLARATLALAGEPHAAWVEPTRIATYPTQRTWTTEPFRALRRFFRPVTTHGFVYRRTVWARYARHVPKPIDGVEALDDWVIQVRAIAAGHVPVAVPDAVVYLHGPSLPETRSTTKRTALAAYAAFRANLDRFPWIARGAATHRRTLRRGVGLRPRYHPLAPVDRIQTLVTRRLGRTDAPFRLGSRLLLEAVFAPRRFARSFTDPHKAITLAEIRAGFVGKPDLRFLDPTPGEPTTSAILFAQTSWTIGGAEQVVREWMHAARSSGATTIVDVTEREAHHDFPVTPGTPNLLRELRAAAAAYADEQHGLETLGETPLARARAFWALICRLRPKVIVISGNAFAYALLPHVRRHFPDTFVVDILHNEWFDWRDWFNVSTEYAGDLDERITISDHWGDALVDKYGERRDRVHVFPNAIDTDRFQPDPTERARQRSRLKIPEGVRLVGFVGRLHPQKAPQVFFELARRCAGDPTLHFVVVGDGELRDTLLAGAADLKNLTYLGPTRDVPAIMNALDVAVFTSMFEGFPLTSLEAAAVGVPIVAPDIVGFREQIEAGSIGLLYQPTGDTGVDAERIHAILTDSASDLAACAATARKFVVRDHDLAVQTKLRSAFLRGLLEARVPAPAASGERKRVILHIGTPKTGSTSLQWFLYTYGRVLRRSGILYPDKHLYGYAHFPFAWAVAENPRAIPAEAAAAYPDAASLAAQMREFVASFADAPEHTIVLSCEGMATSSPRAVAELLAGFDVRIVVYLRRQDAYVESSYNQMVKMGGERRTIEQFARERHRKSDYEPLLDPWAAEFGVEAITVVPFEPASFPDGLERGFLDLIGVPWSSSFRTEKLNTGLSRDALEFLRTADHLRAELPRARYRAMVDALEGYSRAHPDPPPFRRRLSPTQRAALLAHYEPSNQRVAERFLPGRGALFTETVDANEPWAPYPGLAPADRARIVAFLAAAGFPTQASVHRPAPAPARGSTRTKTIHVHIGLHKTGTSSIQAFLQANRARLAAAGYTVPDTLGGDAHHRLGALLRGRRAGVIGAGLGSQYRSFDELRVAVDAAHDRALEQPGDHLIYSTESFQGAGPQRLADYFEPAPVQVIVFLRRQDAWVESIWNQRTKQALSLPDTPQIQPFLDLLNFFERLEPWANVFGRDAVTVVPFEREQLPLGLERHFLAAIGLDDADGFVFPPPINRRLNRDCAAFHHDLRSRKRLGTTEGQRLLRLLETISDHDPDPPEWRHAFPPAERIALLDQVRASNAQIAREYLGRADGILFHAPEPTLDEPWAPYPGLSDERRAQITARLLDMGFDVELLRS